MTRRHSIITGAAVLAIQAAFLNREGAPDNPHP
jgi:hypothetical protein